MEIHGSAVLGNGAVSPSYAYPSSCRPIQCLGLNSCKSFRFRKHALSQKFLGSENSRFFRPVRIHRASSKDGVEGSNDERGAVGVEVPEQEKEDLVSDSTEEIRRKLKELREQRDGKQGGWTEFWTGVLEETSQIEWPPFQKVLGTTGVVLAVIVGSAAVLLTVNGILAEVSDKVFNGIGVQDILWGK